ncbi:dolichyl-diphosphooligosaccharide--protein glycotransferase [Candidatus Nitrosopumilus koreensis AR1]|uniref:dolichyl-phosphooligosaccharide-protein glycotransferase n=1 Tax=Candidatus Nitrosopumilus koreensis AR1 TaxID=1229908 RepID=K0B4Z0_9ARCH|nr:MULTISPECIES: STT3 domain-containing protein [Nitrosopumilus]AFS79950.1 dolichyl-diphosphooligosaccharide--protein glycotransferase [Candidatus Nitrosopumilus koreensis AR1]
MNSNSTLISVGNFDFKLSHLLIIGILALSFSISFLVRSQPAEWGWELNEFDPFFNYRATEYLVNNGVDAYFQWDDELSWYPHGRNVSETSQVALHLTAATTYWVFGAGGNLYDFTILFPVIFGSLTTIVLFALVRVIGGTTAGLFSALLFSVSIPILTRGTIGWFKSEPLGLFFAILALYLLLSGINSKNNKIAIPKLVSGGFFIILGLSAWGGNQFFIIPLGLFFLILPFLRKDHKFLIWAIPIFSLSATVTSLGFERITSNFIVGLGGFALLIPTVFLVLCIVVQNKSNEKYKTRNGLLFLLSFLVATSAFLVINASEEFIPLPSHRYLNAINPFLTTTDPLVDSVSEHATTTIQHSFFFHSVIMLFAGIGIWMLIKNSKSSIIQNDMKSFSLILGITGVYTASAFLRLEVFASISVIILASLGISILCQSFFSNQTQLSNLKNSIIKLSFGIGLIVLLIIPLTSYSPLNVFQVGDNPFTMLNGGTNYAVATNDWNDSLEWIKNNTPENSVVAAWWDYGYWIQAKSDRTTLADNSTIYTSIIEKIAKIFLSTPDEGWKKLQIMEADYFVIFVAGQRLTLDGNENQPIYILQGGGDESKKQWFMRIAGEPLNKHLQSDGISGTDHFWNNTLLGKMIPFNLIGYVNFQTNQQSLSYQPGFTAIYEKDVKFSPDEDGPLRLVYSSPSFDASKGEAVIGVFIYEINKDYVPLD